MKNIGIVDADFIYRLIRDSKLPIIRWGFFMALV